MQEAPSEPQTLSTPLSYKWLPHVCLPLVLTQNPAPCLHAHTGWCSPIFLLLRWTWLFELSVQDVCCSFQPLAFYQWGGHQMKITFDSFCFILTLVSILLSNLMFFFFFFLLWLCLFSIFCQDLKVHIFPMTPGSSHLCSIIPRLQFQEGRASPWGLPKTLVFSWTPFLNLTGLNSK